MKTQEIFSYVVTENINVKDATTGQIEKIAKKVHDSGIVAAYDEASARLKALANAKISSTSDKIDIDEVEVLVRPF